MTYTATKDELKKIDETFKVADSHFSGWKWGTTIETNAELPSYIDTRFLYYEKAEVEGGYFTREVIRLHTNESDYEKANGLHHIYEYILSGDEGFEYLVRDYKDYYEVYNTTKMVWYEEPGMVVDDRTDRRWRRVSFSEKYREEYNRAYDTILLEDDCITRYYPDGKIEKERLY